MANANSTAVLDQRVVINLTAEDASVVMDALLSGFDALAQNDLCRDQLSLLKMCRKDDAALIDLLNEAGPREVASRDTLTQFACALRLISGS